jgi:aminobenzoyl-glutamate utilization protein B
MKASRIVMAVHSKSTLIFGALALSALLAVPTTATAQSPNNETIGAVERVAPAIEDPAAKLWDLSEISLLEVKSSAYLKEVLKKNGFKITSEKTADIPTAFVAEYGSGKPVLGIMLEYDALPGLGNAAVARKEARKDGITAGQGCGHNAGALGEALALKRL